LAVVVDDKSGQNVVNHQRQMWCLTRVVIKRIERRRRLEHLDPDLDAALSETENILPYDCGTSSALT
jgi:hypothetical protein